MKRWFSTIILAVAAALIVFTPQKILAVEPLIADRIVASSELQDATGVYSAEYLQDFKVATAWAEGVDGYGEGETLRYEYSPGTVLTGGVIFPGYQKSEDTLFYNGAPEVIDLVVGNEYYTLDITEEASTFYGQGGTGYAFTFAQPVTLWDGVITAVIRKTRPGTLYQDTCISELRFVGSHLSADSPQRDGLYLSDSQRVMLASLSLNAYRKHVGWGDYYETTVNATDLNGSEQAFLLYWYQYNCTDSRILTSTAYHAASIYDLAAISVELMGDAVSTDIMQYFLNEYAYEVYGDQIVMNASGDFGDAGNYYFDWMTDYWVEGDQLAVQGPVMAWNSNMQSYVHQNMYTAYFHKNPAGSEIPYCFVSVTIGMDTPAGADGPGSSI